MSTWTKRERFQATLSGEVADRTPVAAWGHFYPAEVDPTALAESTIEFTQKYDWDWIKLNPRATYYAEAWGTHFDLSNGDIFRPIVIDSLISEPADVWRVSRKVAINSRSFDDHVLATALVAKRLPEVPIAQTVFSPLNVLAQIAGQPVDVSDRLPGGSSATLPSLLLQEPEGVAWALSEIAAAFVDYFERIKFAGAEGIFYAITPAANNSNLDLEQVHQLTDPIDQQLIEAARNLGLRVILHSCGPDSDPQRLTALKADAISWDQFSPLNPNLADLTGAVPAGGIDREAIDKGDTQAVAQQAKLALEQLDGQPFLLAPTCAVGASLNNPALSQLCASVSAHQPTPAAV